MLPAHGVGITTNPADFDLFGFFCDNAWFPLSQAKRFGVTHGLARRTRKKGAPHVRTCREKHL